MGIRNNDHKVQGHKLDRGFSGIMRSDGRRKFMVKCTCGSGIFDVPNYMCYVCGTPLPPMR